MKNNQGQIALGIIAIIALLGIAASVIIVQIRNQTPRLAEDDGCACTLEYNPVCGVDGKTYGNACAAGCAKVAVASSGECQNPTPAPSSVSGSNPVVCATAFGACNKNACRFSNNVCDLQEQKQCQTDYTSCMALLPQACVRAYTQCRALSTTAVERTTPCPPEGCPKPKTEVECLAEYNVCASDPSVQ